MDARVVAVNRPSCHPAHVKPPLMCLILLGSISLAQCDGWVDFRNGGITFRIPGDRRIYLGAPGGTLLTGTNYGAQLYYGPAPGDLRPVDAPPAHFRPSSTSSPGVWLNSTAVGNDRTLVGFNAGDTLWLQVRIWDVVKYPSWEAAFAFGEYFASLPFTYTIPLASEGDPSAYYMNNFFPNVPPEETFVPRFFPPVKLGQDIVISWRAPADARLQQANDPTTFNWQDVSNSPTNGILKISVSNGVALFRVIKP